MTRKQTLITIAQERGWEILIYHADGSGLVSISGDVMLEFGEIDDNWYCKVVFDLNGSPNDTPDFWLHVKDELMTAVNLVLGCGAQGNA